MFERLIQFFKELFETNDENDKETNDSDNQSENDSDNDNDNETHSDNEECKKKYK